MQHLHFPGIESYNPDQTTINQSKNWFNSLIDIFTTVDDDNDVYDDDNKHIQSTANNDKVKEGGHDNLSDINHHHHHHQANILDMIQTQRQHIKTDHPKLTLYTNDNDQLATF